MVDSDIGSNDSWIHWNSKTGILVLDSQIKKIPHWFMDSAKSFTDSQATDSQITEKIRCHFDNSVPQHWFAIFTAKRIQIHWINLWSERPCPSPTVHWHSWIRILHNRKCRCERAKTPKDYCKAGKHFCQEPSTGSFEHYLSSQFSNEDFVTRILNLLS